MIFMKKIDEELVDIKNQNKMYVDKLLMLEWVLITISLIVFLVGIYVGVEVLDNLVWQIILVVLAVSVLIVSVVVGIYIEQMAGYYECKKCQYRYVPKYLQVLLAMHFGRTRYMKCPKCHQNSWNKKVLTK